MPTLNIFLSKIQIMNVCSTFTAISFQDFLMNAEVAWYSSSVTCWILIWLRSTLLVGWGYLIHRLHLSRGIRPAHYKYLDMTLNNLMVWFHLCRSFGECGVSFHCYHSQVHSGRSENTREGTIYRSDITVWHLNWIQTNNLC